MGALFIVNRFEKKDFYPCNGQNQGMFENHLALFETNNDEKCPDNDKAIPFVTYNVQTNEVAYGDTECFANLIIENNTDINFTNYYMGIVVGVEEITTQTPHIIYRDIDLYKAKKLGDNKYKLRLPIRYTGLEQIYDYETGAKCCVFSIFAETDEDYDVEMEFCKATYDFEILGNSNECSCIPKLWEGVYPTPSNAKSNLISIWNSYGEPSISENIFKIAFQKAENITLTFDNITP